MPREKSVNYTIKVPEHLRTVFNETCQSRDRTASQEIRDFMRQYIKKHGQQEMFN